MSTLLIDEPPIVILPSLAKALDGADPAAIVQQIHYWIKKPSAPERNGRKWHFDTYQNWLKQFPWLNRRTFQRLMLRLEEIGLVISTNEFNKSKCDRTKWYTLDYEILEKLKLNPSAKLALCTTQGFSDPVPLQKPYESHSAKMAPPGAKMAPPTCQNGTMFNETKTTAKTTAYKKLASGQPVDKEPSAEEVEVAKAKLAALLGGESLKLAGRAPKDEVKAEPMPEYQPEPHMPIAQDDAPLMQRLREAGVGEGNIRAVLRVYADRRQIVQALEKLALRQAKGAVKNPEALFMTIVKDPYQEPKASQSDEERAARLHQEAEAERKRKEAALAGEQCRQALISNPEQREQKIGCLREALKRGKPVSIGEVMKMAL